MLVADWLRATSPWQEAHVAGPLKSEASTGAAVIVITSAATRSRMVEVDAKTKSGRAFGLPHGTATRYRNSDLLQNEKRTANWKVRIVATGAKMFVICPTWGLVTSVLGSARFV